MKDLRDAYTDHTVLVTGGAGFIGSHLVDALVDGGAHVRVIDDLCNGREENLTQVRDRIEFVQGSILDDEALGRTIEGCEVVFHQAALGSVPQSVEEPLKYHEVNSTGTLRVLEAARAAGVRCVVSASSSSVYGESEILPKIESMRPMPVSPYAASKLMGEHWCRAYAHCYDLSTVSLRYFNVFGPRQRPDSQYAAVIPAFAVAIMSEQAPIIYGDGGQTRDFTSVGDVVRANLLAGASDRKLSGEAINIACGQRISLLELLGDMSRIVGTEIEPEFRDGRAGDVRHSQADVALAGEIIGFEAVVGMKEGLRSTLESFTTNLQP